MSRVEMNAPSLSSVSSYNDYRPTPLEGSEKERVMQKIEELSSGI